MKCANCGSEDIRAFITIQMYIDAKDNNHLNKKVIAKKSSEIWYQLHDKTSYTCKSCCNSWGYGYNIKN